MKTQQLTIGNQTNFAVTMAADITGVDEVVVVGYLGFFLAFVSRIFRDGLPN